MGGKARSEIDEVTSNCFGYSYTLCFTTSLCPSQLCYNPQTLPGYTDQSDTVHDGLILLKETCLTIPAIIHHTVIQVRDFFTNVLLRRRSPCSPAWSALPPSRLPSSLPLPLLLRYRSMSKKVLHNRTSHKGPTVVPSTDFFGLPRASREV